MEIKMNRINVSKLIEKFLTEQLQYIEVGDTPESYVETYKGDVFATNVSISTKRLMDSDFIVIRLEITDCHSEDCVIKASIHSETWDVPTMTQREVNYDVNFTDYNDWTELASIINTSNIPMPANLGHEISNVEDFTKHIQDKILVNFDLELRLGSKGGYGISLTGPDKDIYIRPVEGCGENRYQMYVFNHTPSYSIHVPKNLIDLDICGTVGIVKNPAVMLEWLDEYLNENYIHLKLFNIHDFYQHLTSNGIVGMQSNGEVIYSHATAPRVVRYNHRDETMGTEADHSKIVFSIEDEHITVYQEGELMFVSIVTAVKDASVDNITQSKYQDDLRLGFENEDNPGSWLVVKPFELYSLLNKNFLN